MRMKKMIWALLLLAGVTLQARAQAPQKFWIGGSFGISSSDYDDGEEQSSKSNGFSIQPELGYAFSERWAAGLRLGFGQSKQEGSSETKGTDFSVAPFVRYTCLNWRKFSVFVDGGVRYGQVKQERNYEEDIYDDYDETSNRYGVFLQPGFALQLSPCIALTGRLNFLDVSYQAREADYSTNSDVEERYFSAGLNSPFNMNNFTIGFNFSF